MVILRLLKFVLAFYRYWTHKHADTTFSAQVIRVVIFVLVSSCSIHPIICSGEYAVFKVITFIIGSVSLTLTPYLQDKDYTVGSDGDLFEGRGYYINAVTPRGVWIFFGILCWVVSLCL